MTIFTMRLCTIYVMRPNFRRFLIITLVITLLSYFTFYGVALHYLIPSMAWNPLARTCVIPNFQTWALGAIYLTPIFMESVIFFSTVLHSIGYHRELAGLRNRSTDSVLKRFYIDGAQYYGLVLGLRIGSVCVFFLAPLGLQVLFRYLEYLVSSTLTSRYFLSFRRTILNATQNGLGIEDSITQGTSELTGSTSWRTKMTPTVDEEDGAFETRDHENGTIRLHMDLIDLETAGNSRSRVGLQSSSAESSVELRNSSAKGNQAGIAGN
ncbi:hypothetical protein FRC20_004035 [Serendipita sp. 405]|nr:hypothetical protein FRC15_004097 [Serendipita sp. 397]KAG8843199.1 hypothetical protein FRC20_004035 [Serendipita sp. 405]